MSSFSLNVISIFFFVMAIFFGNGALATENQKPPQFVLLAFDGSKALSVWQSTRDFTQEMRAQNIDVRFTYFISGVYFLGDSTKRHYQGPGRAAGRSDIGFGTSGADILTRTDHLNHAVTEGHEMASHANGHFDGSGWSESDWDSENTQFIDLIFNVFTNNGLNPSTSFPQGMVFEPSHIRGFRAPLLGVSQGLWPSLVKHGITYDTSKTSASNYWPQKSSLGIWNFPLANLRIAGTQKRTLSMDYNFYVAQSQAKPDSANREKYRREMLDTYIAYFNQNYNGNRAPLHIGHHFSMWNGGAYWLAMKDFARAVCGQPDVRCVTYAEYETWLNSQSPEVLNQYQAARSTPPLSNALDDLVLRSQLSVGIANSTLRAMTTQPHLLRQGFRLQWRTGHTFLQDGAQLSTNNALRKTRTRSFPVTLELLSPTGKSIKTATQWLRFTPAGLPRLDSEIIEDRALMGDLIEAHLEETN